MTDRRDRSWVLFALIAALAAFARLLPIEDFDTAWHLAGAQDVLRHGSWIYPDSASFTLEGEPYVNISWLSQLAMYGLWQVGGFDALVLFTAAAAAISALLVGAIARRSAPGRPWLAAGVTALVVGASSFRFEARPQSFFLIFLPAAILAATAYASARQRRLAGALGLIGFQLIWAHSHGSFVLLPAIVSVALLAQLGRFGPARLIRELGLPALLALLCVTAGPHGLGHLELIALLPYGDATSHIGEMRPLEARWMIPSGWSSFLWLDVLLMLGAVRSLRHRRLRFADFALALLGLGITMSHHRFRAAWAILIAPWVARDHGQPSAPFERVLGALALAAVIPLTIHGRNVADPVRGRGISVNQDELPIDLATAIDNAGVKGKLFNVFDDGGWLALLLRDKVQIALDGRTPSFFDDDLYFLLRRALAEPVAFAIVEKRYAPDMASPVRQAPLCGQLVRDPRWRAVYLDRRRTLFTRGPGFEAFSSVGAINPCAPGSSVETVCRGGDANRIERAQDELQAMIELHPTAPFPLILRARLETLCGDRRRGAELAVRGLASGTRDPTMHVWAASAFAASGGATDALRTMDRALRLGAGDSARIYRGRLRIAAGDIEGGISDLLAGVRALDDLAPADVRLDLARALAASGDAQHAIVHARRAWYMGGHPAAARLLETLGARP